jgi:hypothetical protein
MVTRKIIVPDKKLILPQEKAIITPFALPVYSKSWQFNCNNLIAAQGANLADMRLLWRTIKNQMLAIGLFPWNVKYSCNSVTAGVPGDGVDRWVTDSNLVWNQAGGAHSWIVLGQPAILSTTQILISLSPVSGGNQQNFRYAISNAGFTGGTTSNDPTATDAVAVIASNTPNFSTDLAMRWTIEETTDGQCTRIIIFAGGNLVMAGFIDKLANPTAGTPGYANGGVIGFTPSAGLALINAGTSNHNGVSTTVNASWESASALAIPSEISGAWDLFPMAACGMSVGGRGRLGTFQDMWVGSSGIATGDVYPATGTPINQFIQIGQVVMPWNNGPVNLS